MDLLAARYRANEVQSIFLYTHEAHPGENLPHLQSMDQKFEHARMFKDEIRVERPILLDSLDGACHRAFGSMPNMTWIISRTGSAVYKSDWTDVLSVQSAVEYLLDVRGLRKSGTRMVPFRVERLDYRVQDEGGFTRGLERSGPKAVQEFAAAFDS